MEGEQVEQDEQGEKVRGAWGVVQHISLSSVTCPTPGTYLSPSPHVLTHLSTLHTSVTDHTLSHYTHFQCTH